MNRVTKQLLVKDVELFNLFYQGRSNLLDFLMLGITHLGGSIFIITFSLSFFLFEPLIARQLLAVQASISLLVYIIKRKVNRSRPYKAIEEVEFINITFEPYSFPSGHTTASFALATILSFYYPDFWYLLFSIAALIGISRVYLGVHYPSDITIGALLGVVFAYLVHLGFLALML